MANPFVEKLATGEWSVERFRRHLEEAGAPLVERVPAARVTSAAAGRATDEVEVTFIDEPGPDTTVALSVAVGSQIGRSTIDTEFTAVPGTPFQVLTVPVRSDLRFGYVFTRRRRTGQEEQVADPFNPPPRFSEYPEARFAGSSVAALPNAAPLPWLDRAETGPMPATDTVVLKSDLLGSERRIWISMPPGEQSSNHTVPYVIHFDGTPEHSAPSIRDALLDAGLIRPCAVILVETLAPQRYTDLRCNPAFSQMLIDELLPWLHNRYQLSRDPAEAALAGESYGGLCAAWTALHHPTTFGNAILQSPSCEYHPDLTWDTAAASDLLHRTPIPTLMADFSTAEPAPLRIFHNVGELEGSLTHSRWLNQVLINKGYDTCYREFTGGHDHAWWRGLFADALLWCFPVTTEHTRPYQTPKICP